MLCAAPFTGRCTNVPLPERWVERIIAMRRRMETRSKTRSGIFLDLKLGPGGMADIEFAAQMVQLKMGSSEPDLRGKSTPEILSHPAASILGDDVQNRFFREYSMFRELVKLIRITLVEKTTILPEEENLETLARVFGRTDAEELRARVASHQ